MASLSIRKQIYLAVGCALALLTILAMISYLAIVQLAGTFADYKATAHQTLLANEFLEDVYNTQLAAFGYRLTPSEQEAQAVWDGVVQIADRQSSAEQSFDDHDLAIDVLQRISSSTHEYRDAFARMIELKAESDKVVDQLSTIGQHIRQTLTAIMKFAYENGDTWVGYDVGIAQQEFMRGRFYNERYLITNESDTFDAAMAFMQTAKQSIEELSSRLYDPGMQQLAKEAASEISAYVAAAEQNHDVLMLRNDVRDTQLDALGPKIKSEIEALLDSVIDRQRTLGSTGSRDADTTLLLVFILSISALCIGIALAIFVARRISGRICAMAETMSELASGDLDIAIGDTEQQYEIGMMARALEVFRVNARKLQQSLDKERELNGLQRQFVSMVSHEFRTPLAIIDGSAQRLQRRPEKISPERVNKAVATIHKSVVRLTDLMESVLSAARMEGGQIRFEPEAFDIREMVAEVCRNYAEISENHQIVVEIEMIPESYVGDVKLLRQVISNLVSNAVKYSPDNTTVFVSGAQTDEGGVIISVKDEGVGIPSSELEKLFERFFRASTSTGIPGSGIGLHLVKQLVELHHGELSVKSDVGKGSTFEVHLPISEVVPSAKSMVDHTIVNVPSVHVDAA